VLFRYALAAFMGLSACSDDGGNDAVPNAGDVAGPTTTVELRQTASLSGGYASQIRIDGEGWPANTSAQDLTLTFVMQAMTGVRQFELRIEPEPASAFDVAGAVFAATQPFVTPFASGIQLEGDVMRMGGASLSGGVDGVATLGTLTIRTSNNFNAFTDARLVVTLLSIGPSSSDRDEYQTGTLQLGVNVGGR
jgi:hypothetical protein